MKCAGKWMEVEETVLSEIIQTQKDKRVSGHLLLSKIKIMLQSSDPERVSNEEGLGGTHGSPWEGELE